MGGAELEGALLQPQHVRTGGSALGLLCHTLRAELLATVGVCRHGNAWLLSAGAGAGAGARFGLLQLRSLRNLVQLRSEAVPSDHEDVFRGAHCSSCEVHAK